MGVHNKQRRSAKPARTADVAGSATVPCRRAAEVELDAALAAWARANAGHEAPGHLDNLRRWSRQPGAVLGVAVDAAGAVVGMGLLLAGRADDGAGELLPDLGHLTGVCVLPGKQRTGIGSALLDFMLAEALAAGRTRVTLWTHSDNGGARRVFERHGFEATGRERLDAGDRAVVHYARQIRILD